MSTSHPAELQLLDYVEGSLAGEELKGLRRHITHCSACQETLRELSHAVDALDRLPTVEIPHDEVRHRVSRNRRRLLTRALPIFALVVAAGAVAQELRPGSTGSRSARTSAQAAGRPVRTSISVVTHVSPTRSDRDDIATRLAGFDAYIPPDHGSLVALVDLDDLTGAEARLEQGHGSRLVTVLLVGVQGLDGGLSREQIDSCNSGAQS
jgi:anti-sigma factor RsiW